MTKKIVVIQKGNDRYTFRTDIGDGEFNEGHEYYWITHEHLLTGGASMTRRPVLDRDEGNQFYLKLLSKGFKRFRSIHEISWYATIENYTPYEEEWVVEGNYLVPVKSRVLD